MVRVEQSGNVNFYSSNNATNKVKGDSAEPLFDYGNKIGDGFETSDNNPHKKIINTLKSDGFGLKEYLNMEDEPFESVEDMLRTIAPNYGFTAEEMDEMLDTVDGKDIEAYLERMLQDPEMSTIYNEMLNDYEEISSSLKTKTDQLADAKSQKEIDKLQQEIDELKVSKRYVHTEILGDILIGIQNERKAAINNLEQKRLDITESNVKEQLKTQPLNLEQFTNDFGIPANELMKYFEIDAEKFAELQKNPEKMEQLMNSDGFKEICTEYAKILNEIEDKSPDLKNTAPYNPFVEEQPTLTADKEEQAAKLKKELAVLMKDKGFIYKDMINYLTQNM